MGRLWRIPIKTKLTWLKMWEYRHAVKQERTLQECSDGFLEAGSLANSSLVSRRYVETQISAATDRTNHVFEAYL